MNFRSWLAIWLSIGVLGGGCSDGSSSTNDGPADEVVPFKMVPVQSAPTVPSESPWRQVSVAIEETPSSVRAGHVLEFVVAIKNGSKDDIDPQALCPAYFLNFGESAESATPITSLLNCDQARPLQPGDVERFAMQIELPEDIELEAGSVYWRLEPYLVDASSTEIAVRS
jgi:hypothetical protein